MIRKTFACTHSGRPSCTVQSSYLQPGMQSICLYVRYKLAYLQPGLQSICLYSCWQVSKYSTIYSLPAAWPAEHLLVPCWQVSIYTSLPAAWPAEHLLVLVLAGLHVDVLLEWVQIQESQHLHTMSYVFEKTNPLHRSKHFK
jgi:hypothetical protein